MLRGGTLLLLGLGAARALAQAAPPPATATAEPSFEAHWQDGRAEISGYRYTVTRYGSQRLGQAVAIYVTEPFSESRRVKVDDPRREPADTFEALKLNLVRDFQTGVYDYNTMVSVFVRSRDLSLAKLSFSSAEWCGHVYEELLFDRGGAVRQSLRSYFEGESAERSLPAPPSQGAAVPVVVEDQLFVLLRGLRGELLRPGEKRTVTFLPGTIVRRLAHQPLAFTSAVLERAAAHELVQVPAGRIPSDLYTVRVADGREGRFAIERAHPHRIVRWSFTSPSRTGGGAGEASESGELTGTARLAYWQLHDNGHERYLKELGLQPLPAPASR
ncbi:MAG: hypothetical protein U1A78_21495 [Polyangia bacterium]